MRGIDICRPRGRVTKTEHQKSEGIKRTGGSQEPLVRKKNAKGAFSRRYGGISVGGLG